MIFNTIVANTATFAVIGVTFPKNNTCVCINDETGKKLVTKTTTGKWLFSIPYTGTWMVTMYDSNDSAIDSVTVNISDREIVEIEFCKEIPLFNNGNQYTDTTGGYKVLSDSLNTDCVQFGETIDINAMSSTATLQITTNNKIDLTDVDSLRVKTINSVSHDYDGYDHDGGLQFGIVDNFDENGFLDYGDFRNMSTAFNACIDQEVLFDVSSFSGEYTIALHSIFGGITIDGGSFSTCIDTEIESITMIMSPMIRQDGEWRVAES